MHKYELRTWYFSTDLAYNFLPAFSISQPRLPETITLNHFELDKVPHPMTPGPKFLMANVVTSSKPHHNWSYFNLIHLYPHLEFKAHWAPLTGNSPWQSRLLFQGTGASWHMLHVLEKCGIQNSRSQLPDINESWNQKRHLYWCTFDSCHFPIPTLLPPAPCTYISSPLLNRALKIWAILRTIKIENHTQSFPQITKL